MKEPFQDFVLLSSANSYRITIASPRGILSLEASSEGVVSGFSWRIVSLV